MCRSELFNTNLDQYVRSISWKSNSEKADFFSENWDSIYIKLLTAYVAVQYAWVVSRLSSLIDGAGFCLFRSPRFLVVFVKGYHWSKRATSDVNPPHYPIWQIWTTYCMLIHNLLSDRFSITPLWSFKSWPFLCVGWFPVLAFYYQHRQNKGKGISLLRNDSVVWHSREQRSDLWSSTASCISMAAFARDECTDAYTKRVLIVSQ